MKYMSTSRSIKDLHLRAAAIVFAGLLMLVSAHAQPRLADSTFTEAKTLAANQATEAEAREKFTEAATLYRASGNKAKANEVELEHGRLLRTMATREREAKRYDESIQFLYGAFEKVRLAKSAIDIAYVAHDLGYTCDLKGNQTDALEFYGAAALAYREAGDKAGESIVLRNIGITRSNENKFAEAIQNFESALKLRIATGDISGQAELQSDIGDALFSDSKYAEALVRYNSCLLLYRQVKDSKGEAAALYKLGILPSAVMKPSDALVNLESALTIYDAEKDYVWQAASHVQIGRLKGSLGKYQEANSDFSLAVEIYAILGNLEGEANAAIDLAQNFESLNRYEDARTAVERALKKYREGKSRVGEGYAMLIYAEIHLYLNEHDAALAKIQAAEKIFAEEKIKSTDVRIAQAYATHYYGLSNYGEAIRYGLAALKMAERDGGDPGVVSSIYADLGNAYSQLGQKQKSIEFTTKALELSRKIHSEYAESICLSNIGYAYFGLDNFAQAESFLQKAIAIMRRNGYGREEGYAVHNLGLVYYKRGEYQKALESYERAYPLYRAAGDRRPESFLYDSFGELYRDQALSNMMTLWTRRGQPRLAILYGKQAVNVHQSIRASNTGVDKDSQKSLVKSKEKTYRQLANLLIDEGRLAEAQQVLDLLKAEEYFDFVRRDSSEASDQATLALNETERKALEEYSRVSASLTSLGQQFQTLQDKKNKNGGKLIESEEAEYLRLKKQVEDAGEGLKTFFSKLTTEFSKKVVLVSTYLLPERYRAIVTTGRTMVDRKVEYSSLKLTGADINRKIFEFQRALQNPNADPRPLGKELYDIFVKPLEGDLKGAGAKTILWSLDGSLRYIPLAALSPDGKTYLAERYQNVVVTLGRQTNLFTKPSTDEWRAIGAGVSKPHTGFSALPSVPGEIGSIVHDDKQTGGILNGMRMLDEQFNLESLRNTVPQQTEDGHPFNVLHLATHFSLGANDQDSALLLGDGTRLSLFDIGRDEALDFKDVELLTLSACQTGVSTGDANGREVESLGMLAQKKGAKAVLATLWKVADESTSLFMTEFYRIKKANPTMNKAEAIRLAQKEMIDGKIKASGKSNSCRAEEFAGGTKQNEFKCDPNAPFSHPYFWSPFVLIGNWR
ncbi:MAG: hypothetical protein DMF63_01845 [Acidobacteria bacterium]|nr:MAG: hypothetical protein DMF63_01845 [Acidobacteriota bacterium]